MTVRRSPGPRLGRPIARRTATARPSDVVMLGRVAYFRALTPSALGALARRCRARTLAAGQTLFEEGAACTGLFIVAEGRVEVRQISASGREQVFHTEEQGATLGEGPLFDGGGYIASAVAAEPTRVLFLPKADLVALCRRHPDVALAIMETLARRVRRFAGIVSDLIFRPITERLAAYLDSAATHRSSSTDAEVTLSLTHGQLAARLGTVRELIARAFAQLERTSIISRDGKRVVIRDPVRLRALAGRAGLDGRLAGGVT